MFQQKKEIAHKNQQKPHFLSLIRKFFCKTQPSHQERIILPKQKLLLT